MSRPLTLLLVLLLATPALAIDPATLDSTFGTGGKVTAGGQSPRALVLQSDGRIVLAGAESGAGTSRGFLLARFDAAGAPDPSFGTAGVVTTRAFGGASEDDVARALVVEPDGRLVAAGTWSAFIQPGMFGAGSMLARYQPDGTLDTTFHTFGLRLDQGPAANAMIRQPMGATSSPAAAAPEDSGSVASTPTARSTRPSEREAPSSRRSG